MNPAKATASECEALAQAANEASGKVSDALRQFLHATRRQISTSRALAKAANQARIESGTYAIAHPNGKSACKK